MITHSQLIDLGFTQCTKCHNRYEKQECFTKYVAILKSGKVIRLNANKTNIVTGKVATVSHEVSDSSVKDFILTYEEITGYHLPYFKDIDRKIFILRITAIFLLLVLVSCLTLLIKLLTI